MTVVNGGVHVNSTDPRRAATVGGFGKVTAAYIGGPAGPGGFERTLPGAYDPTPVYLPAVADPLAALQQCPAAGSVCPTTVRANVSIGGVTARTIQPGIYTTISAGGTSRLTLAPGTYIIKGSLTVSGVASITGTGVTLYLACTNYPNPCAARQSGATLNLGGGGSISISGPTSGAFQGVTVFADRNNRSTTKLSGIGSGPGGTIYLRSGRLDLANVARMTNGLIVVDTAVIGGVTRLTINVPPAP